MSFTPSGTSSMSTDARQEDVTGSEEPIPSDPTFGHLDRIGRRPSLGKYMAQLWQRRHFIWADSKARSLSSNRGTFLGNAWLILKPLLDGAIYAVIFGFLFHVNRGIVNFPSYVIIGTFLFRLTSSCMNEGAGSITGGKNMIHAFAFPRAALPLSVVTRGVVSMVPMLVTMAALILAIPPHADLTWRWLLFPVVLLLQTILNTGLAFITARLTFQVPDFKLVLGVVTRILFYGSGVFFSIERFVHYPRIQLAMENNPIFLVLDMSRKLLLYGRVPALSSWVRLTEISVLILLLGYVFFWGKEQDYGRP
jgi:teichoic acid transport system permease protein